MKKIVSFLVIAALVLSFVPFSAFAVAITSIEFTPADPNAYVFYEGQNAETRYDDATGDTYLAYNVNFSQGDTLTIHYSDNSHKDYVADWIDGEIYFINGEEKLKQWDDVTKFDNQGKEHWVVGGEYTFDVIYVDGDIRTSVTAKILPSPVDSISYKSGRPIVYYSETNGQTDIDKEGHEFFRYSGTRYLGDYPDVLTVNYNDGRGSVDYTLSYDPDFGYYSDGGDFIPDRDVRIFDYQFDNPFTLGDNNYFYVEYLGKTAPVQVTIVENPIEDLVYIPVREIEIYENTNGQWDTDGQGKPFFNYSFPDFQDGDLLNVTYADTHQTVSYTYLVGDYGGRQFFGGFYDVLNDYEELPDQNLELHKARHGNWELGDGNFMYVTYKDNVSNYVRVNVVENPVADIRYEPAKPRTYVEGDTYYDNLDDSYYYSTPEFEDGDKLIIIDKNGGETVYICDKDSSVFMTDDYSHIGFGDVDIYAHQNQTPWVIGDQNEYYVSYMGKEYTLYATVTENPIASIEYTPVEPIVLIEGKDSFIDSYYGESKYTRYNYPTQNIGDKLTINYKDQTKAEFVITLDGDNAWVFKNTATGDTFSPWDVRFTDDQYHNPWHIGSGNDLYIVYKGVTYTYDATIIENPVKEIRFIPVTEPVVYSGANSYYSDFYKREIYYEPGFNVGDRLIVVDKTDTETVYFARNDEHGDMVFAADGKDILRTWEDVFTSSNQEEGEPWHIGTGNEYFVEYMGHAAPATCTVKDNPVASIEYIRANNAVYLEGTHSYREPWAEVDTYEIPWIDNGDILRVTYVDRTVGTIEYTAKFNSDIDEMVFESESGDIIPIENNRYIDVYSDQYVEPWKIGENFYTFSYMGCVSQAVVTIIENNFDSMFFTPADGNPVVYESYSHPAYREDGSEFREYAIPDFREGDKISLLGQGAIQEFVLTFCEEDGELYFVGDNFKFHQYEVFRDSKQYEREWTLEGPNYYTIELFGLTADVQIDLVQTDVKSVEYIRKTPLVIDENKNGDYIFDNFGVKFYFYNVPLADVGDKIIITFKDDTSKEYTVKFDVDNNVGYAESNDGDILNVNDVDIFDRQYDEHWIPGGDNKFYVLYRGIETSVPVTITPMDSNSGDYTGGEEPTDHDHIIIPGYSYDAAFHWNSCALCDWQVDKERHTFEWVVVREATDTALGLKEEVCSVCGYKTGRSEIIPKLPSEYIPGDINNDGAVNNKDLTRLFQYLSDWDVEVNRAALDVNGDGSVNNKDLTRLFQYLSDWDVEIH